MLYLGILVFVLKTFLIWYFISKINICLSCSKQYHSLCAFISHYLFLKRNKKSFTLVSGIFFQGLNTVLIMVFFKSSQKMSTKGFKAPTRTHILSLYGLWWSVDCNVKGLRLSFSAIRNSSEVRPGIGDENVSPLPTGLL